MSARIPPDVVARIGAALEPFDTPEAREAYSTGVFRAHDMNERYRWDLFWKAGCWNLLPEGVKDDHIDTALRAVIKPL